jgi:hypothetical protein
MDLTLLAAFLVSRLEGKGLDKPFILDAEMLTGNVLRETIRVSEREWFSGDFAGFSPGVWYHSCV